MKTSETHNKIKLYNFCYISYVTGRKEVIWNSCVYILGIGVTKGICRSCLTFAKVAQLIDISQSHQNTICYGQAWNENRFMCWIRCTRLLARWENTGNTVSEVGLNSLFLTSSNAEHRRHTSHGYRPAHSSSIMWKIVILFNGKSFSLSPVMKK